MKINHLVSQASFSYSILHALQSLFVLVFFPQICLLITWLISQASFSYSIRHALQSLFVLLFCPQICLLITWLATHHSRTLFCTHYNPYLFYFFPVDMPINHLIRQALFLYFIRHTLQSLFVLPFFR